ncbi:MAG: hypothetical protein HWQ23_22640 [Nostoc sp. JL33]|nr:hypothetical protein [Nostoc sp. JL33]MBN3872966.1 hypothetical protein [Nostoc sp. JL33]
MEYRLQEHRRFLRPSTELGSDFVATNGRALKLEVLPVREVSGVGTSH